ncbi:uncharacterized protein LOC114723429 [Neltuma alba]|uniref:uncharacterized protein LOC114723429 n=1 Tax=Neltuma alba TaxID=207710 RepID=UPI0010A50F2F|nr:uncharacterized protein LOC114723429 [Prosopis alba]
MRNSPSMPMVSVLDQVKLLHKLDAVQFQGHDSRGHPVLTVVGKLFPAPVLVFIYIPLPSIHSLTTAVESINLLVINKPIAGGLVSREGVNKYLEENVFPEVGERAWSVLYIHTGVQRGHNLLGVWPLKSVCDAIPLRIKLNLQALYFLHPDLPARVELLWEHVRRGEMKIPEFVHDHDKELEYPPWLHFDVDRDPTLYYASPFMQTSLPFYSMRFMP